MDKATLAVANGLDLQIKEGEKNLRWLNDIKTNGYSNMAFVALKTMLGVDDYQKVVNYAIRLLADQIKVAERKLEAL